MNGKYWDKPWSLVDGCTPVSEGCEHCWSRAMNQRFGKWPEKVTPRWDRLDIPLKMKKRTVWAVWNDLFHEGYTRRLYFGCVWGDGLLFISCIHRSDQRSRRMREFFEQSYIWALIEGSAQKVWHERTGEDPSEWMAVHELPNTIGMVTAENQEMANLRIPDLLATPWSIRGVSIEPCLGPIDLSPFIGYNPIKTQQGGKYESNAIRKNGYGAVKSGELEIDNQGRIWRVKRKTGQKKGGTGMGPSEKKTGGARHGDISSSPVNVELEKGLLSSSSACVSPLLRRDSTRKDDKSQERKQKGQSSREFGDGDIFGKSKPCLQNRLKTRKRTEKSKLQNSHPRQYEKSSQ